MRGNLQERPAPASSRGAGRDVLIVGHDLAETDLLTTTPESAGYSVVGTADTGAGPVGARVCSLAPGITDTPQGRQEAAKQSSMRKLVDAAPLGRTGSSEEVADVVAFMLSDGASFLNGIDILVDGGVYAAVRDR